jgi:hypothetical protein
LGQFRSKQEQKMSLIQSDYWLQDVLSPIFTTAFSGLFVRLFSNNLTFDHTTPLSSFTECTFPGYVSQAIGAFGSPGYTGSMWQMLGTMLTFVDTGPGPDNVYGYYVTDATPTNWYWAQLAPGAPIVLGTSLPAVALLPAFGYQDIP